MKDVFLEAIDTGAPRDYRKKLEAIVKGTAGVKSIHAIRTRKLGGNWCVDLHILVAKDISVLKGHEIAKTVENNILKGGLDVVDVLVHVEPYIASEIK